MNSGLIYSRLFKVFGVSRKVPLILLLFFLTVEFLQAVIYPKRNFFSSSVGYISVDEFRGSACIAWDPRLVFSCAHVFYEDGWGSDFKFFPGYNSSAEPSSGGYPMRGYRYFSDYADYALNGKAESDEGFNWDFVILYNNADIGDSLGAWHDGGSQLRSKRSKLIAGYPAKIDYTGAKGSYYQHATDLFITSAQKEYESYHGFDGVSTGNGNSGGPVFVYDDQNQPCLAGILVSGSEDSAGVRALDQDTKAMAEAAIGDSSKKATFRNNTSLRLPDGASRFSSRAVEVTGFTSTLKSLKFSLNISTTYRGDLEVYLESPKGRIRWVSKRQGKAADNLVLKSANYTASFPGAPNGNWTLYMRDAVKRNSATFNSFSLDISAN